MKKSNSNVAIIVPAHDSYKDIVLIWCQALKKYWKQCPYRIFWVNGNETLQFDNVNVIHSGEDSTYCGRILNALENIDEQYVMIWSEDYILTQQFDSTRITEIVDYMEKSNSVHCRLIPFGKVEMRRLPTKKLYEINPTKPYALSINVGIFSKDFLLSVLNKDWSGWDMEKQYLELSKQGKCFGCLYDDTNNGKMIHLVKQGLMFPDAVKKLKKHGFEFVGNREVMSYQQSILFNLTTHVSGICPSRFRLLLKSLVKKFGIEFIT